MGGLYLLKISGAVFFTTKDTTCTKEFLGIHFAVPWPSGPDIGGLRFVPGKQRVLYRARVERSEFFGTKDLPLGSVKFSLLWIYWEREGRFFLTRLQQSYNEA